MKESIVPSVADRFNSFKEAEADCTSCASVLLLLSMHRNLRKQDL